MTALNKQALRKLAKALSGKEWVAFVHKASGTYAVGSLGHERGEDIIKWPGLDGQDNAESKAKFIAAANPAAVLALLDELEVATDACNGWQRKYAEADERLRAAESGFPPLTVERLIREKEGLEKRIAELEARELKVEMPESFYPDGDIEAPLVLQEHEVIAAIVAAGGTPIAFCRRCKSELDLSHRPDGSHYCHAPAAGSGVKGE
ncbi:hypothetical protein JGY70_002458 [Salmonella enterica]|nr:hypothetical protein [Salmonella enterica]